MTVIERVTKYLEQFGLGDRVKEFDTSSATVELAAADLDCEEARIGKSMAFKVNDGAIVIVMAGDAKTDNAKYKARFHTKATMVKPDELVEIIGFPMGGVCPFDVNDGVKVYLDVSLKRFDIVYPAAGTASSAVKVTIEELEKACSNFNGWVDIAKGWQE